MKVTKVVATDYMYQGANIIRIKIGWLNNPQNMFSKLWFSFDYIMITS